MPDLVYSLLAELWNTSFRVGFWEHPPQEKTWHYVGGGREHKASEIWRPKSSPWFVLYLLKNSQRPQDLGSQSPSFACEAKLASSHGIVQRRNLLGFFMCV